MPDPRDLTAAPSSATLTGTVARRKVTLGLVAYLILFSVFALFHAYANDELVDPRGCQIGQWVQYAQTNIAAVALLSAALILCFFCSPLRGSFLPSIAPFCLTARAPPCSSSL